MGNKQFNNFLVEKELFNYSLTIDTDDIAKANNKNPITFNNTLSSELHVFNYALQFYPINKNNEINLHKYDVDNGSGQVESSYYFNTKADLNNFKAHIKPVINHMIENVLKNVLFDDEINEEDKNYYIAYFNATKLSATLENNIPTKSTNSNKPKI